MDKELAPISPGVPPPPPKLNLKTLWISLLLPPGAMTLFMIVLNLMPDVVNGPNGDTALTLLCTGACLAAMAGWIFYILCLSARFRGASLVLLILAYPVLQVVLLFSIFFVGCLAIVWQEGYL